MSNNEALDDAQGEIVDAVKIVDRMVLDLSSAESCETGADFKANMANAIGAAVELLGELRRIQKDYKEAKS
jgi:hypothetical protein